MKKSKRAIFLLFIIILFIAIVCLSVQRKHELTYTQPYTIQYGDTLWSIASLYRPKTMSIQEYIFNLQQFNSIGSVIYPQQEIQILFYEEV